jgi:hypothetical protein
MLLTQRLPAIMGALSLALLCWPACKNPTPLGADLFGDELANYEFTDTVTVICTVEKADSALTSDFNSAEFLLCGELNDPVFGKSTSDIYALLQGTTINPGFKPASQTFDSIVLFLGYNPAGFYGDTLIPQTLKVHRVDPGVQLRDSRNYFSNESFPANQEIGRVENFYPRPSAKDSLGTAAGAFLRIVLDPEFGKELFNIDSLTYTTDTTFYEKLRGIKISAASTMPGTGAMLAFALNNTTFSFMRLYYHIDSSGAKRSFDYLFRNANKFTHFKHDYSGSAVEPVIGQQANDKLYVQGMQGLRVKLEFPFANKFDRIAVNQAQLVLNVAEETPFLSPIGQLFFTKLNSTGSFEESSDVSFSFGANGTGGFFSFGGGARKVVENSTVLTQYRLTLSDEFQRMVDDDMSTDNKKRTLYIFAYPRSRTASRVVLNGPLSNSFPAKLEVKYTKLR